MAFVVEFLSYLVVHLALVFGWLDMFLFFIYFVLIFKVLFMTSYPHIKS